MAINGSVSRKTRTGYGGRKSSPPGWKEPRNSVLQRRTRKSPRRSVCDSRRSLGRVNPLRTIERLRAGCVLRGPRNKAFKSSIPPRPGRIIWNRTGSHDLTRSGGQWRAKKPALCFDFLRRLLQRRLDAAVQLLGLLGLRHPLQRGLRAFAENPQLLRLVELLGREELRLAIQRFRHSHQKRRARHRGRAALEQLLGLGRITRRSGSLASSQHHAALQRPPLHGLGFGCRQRNAAGHLRELRYRRRRASGKAEGQRDGVALHVVELRKTLRELQREPGGRVAALRHHAVEG